MGLDDISTNVRVPPRTRRRRRCQAAWNRTGCSVCPRW